MRKDHDTYGDRDVLMKPGERDIWAMRRVFFAYRDSYKRLLNKCPASKADRSWFFCSTTDGYVRRKWENRLEREEVFHFLESEGKTFDIACL